MATTKDLEMLEAQIQAALTTKAKAEGAIEEIMRKLKESFDVDSVEEAEQLLETLKARVVSLSKSLDELVVSIKSKLGGS